MPRMTIAQCREREVFRLARYHAAEPSEDDVQQARRIMNSFYRLCGLAEKNLYLANDERTCNRRSTKESEERESTWSRRLAAQLKEYAGLTIFYAGYAPSIGIVDPVTGGCSEKISRFFYG